MKEVMRKANRPAIENRKKTRIFMCSTTQEPREGEGVDVFRQGGFVEGQIGLPQAAPVLLVAGFDGADGEGCGQRLSFPISARS